VHWPTAYEHRNAARFVEPIRAALGRLAPLRATAIEQPVAGLVIFGLECAGEIHRVALDYFDIDAISEVALDTVDVYFKMQFRESGYDAPNVFPGGYVAGAGPLYRHWCRLRRLRAAGASSSDVFGRFGLHGSELRGRAIEILAADGRFRFVGGGRPAEQLRYLREMARARVCIDLPGRGPFCYRLVEAMALGCCVVAVPHRARLPVRLAADVEIAYCAPDLSDLADVCLRYVEDADARDALGSAAAAYFDRNLHPLRLARYYLDTTVATGADR
jgi:glycosyltransferase involved in cell wall biosynthesis